MDLLLRIPETSAIAIGVPLGSYLLAKLFPFKPDALPKQNISIDALRRKYVKWEVAALISFFAFAGVGGYLTYQRLIFDLGRRLTIRGHLPDRS
jgi:hypothetical protein